MSEQPVAPVMSVRDQVASTLRAYGMGDLADWIVGQLTNDIQDPELVWVELRKSPQYKVRFPAMEELQRKQTAAGGRGWTEAEYIQQENAYRAILSTSGLAPDLWDSHDDFAALMRNEVDPTEVQSRVDAAKRAVLATDPAIRDQMQRLYGIGTDQLMGYALVPDRGSDYIKKVATTSIMAGLGSNAGLGTGMSQTQWERYANPQTTEMGYGELQDLVAGAAVTDIQQSRLAGIEGEQFTDTDALDVAVGKDVTKTLASQQRVKRERARFSGSAGVSTGTLTGPTI
jgi:hypothetical protein